ncbi:MAG TPA: apolipoprotein N-acyltransferase [Polyangiales bacterium]|nr:apolipoprotein N-acyltransferase [Polyangiales bacterium]
MKAYLSAAASGVLYALAYEHAALWPLAFVALAPLLYALEHGEHTIGQALRLGLCAGLLQQGGAYRWLLPTIHDYAGMPLWLSLLAWGLLVLYQAGQLALWSAAIARGRALGWPLLALAPLLWGAIEQLYPLLFPSPFAAVLHAQPSLLQGLELAGARPISMLLVLASASIARVACAPRADSRSRRLRTLARIASVWVTLAAFGLWRGEQVNAAVQAAPALSVGLVQANIGAAQKRRDPGALRRIHLQLSRALLRDGAPDLLIWPVTALPGFIPADSRDLSAAVGELGTPLLTGAVAHRNRGGRAELYNSAFLLDPHGHVLGRSDKLQLVPFAERLPLGERFPQLYELAPGAGAFTPGRAPTALELNGRRIAVLICYEDILPELVREVTRASAAQLLVNVTNDAWFGDTAAPHIHLALATLRAIEQRRFLVRATNSGVSAIVGPTGRVLQTLPMFEPGTLRARVALLSVTTLYARIGELAGYLAVAVCALLVAVRRRRRAPEG